MGHEFVISDSGPKIQIEFDKKLDGLLLDIFTYKTTSEHSNIIESSDIIIKMYDKNNLIEEQTYPYNPSIKVCMKKKNMVQNPVITLENSMNISMEWKIHAVTKREHQNMYTLNEKIICSKIYNNLAFSFDIPNHIEKLFFKLNIKFDRINKARLCKIYYSTHKLYNAESVIINKNMQDDVIFIDIFDIIEKIGKERKIYFKMEFYDKYKEKIQPTIPKIYVICELNKIY